MNMRKCVEPIGTTDELLLLRADRASGERALLIADAADRLQLVQVLRLRDQTRDRLERLQHWKTIVFSII